MTALRPFFSFYGSKWRLAKEYPAPKYDTIVEPFAGSAGYSLRYSDRDVILVERDPIVASLWKWLISADPSEILSLPVLKRGENLNDYDMPKEARWLMGFWVNQTGSRPSHKVTEFGQRCQRHERVASQLKHIRHWQVIEGDYTTAPDLTATWFIDPPYQVAGTYYVYGSRDIDYEALAEWCTGRKGQVMACENAGAAWLPFAHLTTHQGATYKGQVKYSQEVVYMNAA